VTPTATDAAPKTLIGQSDIAARVEAMAGEIVAALGQDFTMVIVLKGAFVFGADLLRALGRKGARPRVEFLGLSSYGAEKRSSGDVRHWTPVPEVKGARTLIVEDILDSGLTVKHAREALLAAGATEARICALLDKPAGRQTELAGDFVGFTIPPRFVVGFGIDWAERYRELAHIAAVD